MKILILGASGYVGSRLYFDLEKTFEVFGTYFSNKLSERLQFLDITKKEQVESCISKIKPEIIIHVANNPNSKWCEENPKEARNLNLDSSNTIADLALKYRIGVIYVSTMGAINPFNLYQETKSKSEKVFQKKLKRNLILRPSVGIGMSPNKKPENFFNKLLSQIESKRTLEADTSLIFQPTYLNHISKIVEQCLSNQLWGEIIPISCPEELSSYQIAKDILNPFNIKVLPINNKRPRFNKVKNINRELDEHNLPTLDYKETIKNVVAEIKRFVN